MSMYARDLMVRNFDIISVDAPIEEAVYKISHGVVRETGYKTISLMVVDDLGKLAGVISMFDILYHLRPDFLNYGIDGEELNWEGQLEYLFRKFKGKQVHHFMSRNVVGAREDEHMMVLLDRMVKNRCRRLPVLKSGKPIGIVYISDIYHYLFADRKPLPRER